MSQEQLYRLSDGHGQAAVDHCVRALRAGGMVVIPTETVYGVGILPTHRGSLAAIKSDTDRPFSLAVDSIERLSDELAPLNRLAQRLAKQWWPGPLTQVLPDKQGGHLGVRIPAHPWTRQLLEALGESLLLSSANLPGEPAPTHLSQLSPKVRQAVNVVVDGEALGDGQASTVVAPGLAGLRLLRQGTVSRADLSSVGAGQVAVVCTGNTCRSPMAQGFLNHSLALLGEADHSLILPTVVSAGLHANPGQPPSTGSLMAMASRGINISRHNSRALDEQVLRQTDVLLGMTSSHVMTLLSVAAPDQSVALFDPSGQEVPDPFGGPPAIYEACASHLAQAAHLRARSLLPIESP
ncbi:MAG: tRNA threonylcarbamoyl adenosine modification protein (Sua5/YciO/YrdC/YwlC family) [Pseudohongiellaceae bacterium]|jgi:tRNA threonylcarbamoyl adenosine modification protein (Sua5/YciO/YrdC/YwlC family)